MDFYALDEHIVDTMLDLERSYGAVNLSQEAIERAFDVYFGLNRLLSSESSLSTESSRHVIEAAHQLAFAGVGVDLSKLSTESVVETAKIIGKAILDMLKRFFNMVMDALSNLDVAATWMMQKCNLLERKRVTSIGKVPKEGTVKMGRDHRHLRVGRIFPEDAVKLTSELRRLADVLTIINGAYTTNLVAAGGKLPNVKSTLHDRDLSAALVSIVDDIGFNSLANRLHMSSVDKSRFGRENVMGTHPLIGAHTLYFLQGDLVTKGVKGLRFHGFVFDTTSREAYRVEAEHEFKTMTPADVSGLPDQLRKILSQVSKGSTDGTRLHMKKLRNDLDRFIGTKANDPEVSSDDMDMLRSVVSAFTNWSKITLPLYGTTMSVCRATLSYAQMSVRTWG